jgi:hypothetical protein
MLDVPTDVLPPCMTGHFPAALVSFPRITISGANFNVSSVQSARGRSSFSRKGGVERAVIGRDPTSSSE